MNLEQLNRALQGHVPGLAGVKAQYAVLVPVVETTCGLSLLFEVRADTLNHQPGEICFPGGRVEPGEGPQDCALRETWEELHVPAEDIRLIAPLDRMLQTSGLLLHPFLARLDPARLSPSPAEVKETFLVPLEFFLTHPPQTYACPLVPQVSADFPYAQIGFPQGYPWRTGTLDVPVYFWQERAIWGLTGRVIQHLIRLLKQEELPWNV